MPLLVKSGKDVTGNHEFREQGYLRKLVSADVAKGVKVNGWFLSKAGALSHSVKAGCLVGGC